MNTSKRTLIAILIVASILLSGCTEVSNETTDEVEDNIPLPDCELDNSCIDDTLDNEKMKY
jgi:PBP1b-binding outer membrane lipoprotein LpoB